jgi:hypothetical protein
VLKKKHHCTHDSFPAYIIFKSRSRLDALPSLQDPAEAGLHPTSKSKPRPIRTAAVLLEISPLFLVAQRREILRHILHCLLPITTSFFSKLAKSPARFMTLHKLINQLVLSGKSTFVLRARTVIKDANCHEGGRMVLHMEVEVSLARVRFKAAREITLEWPRRACRLCSIWMSPCLNSFRNLD